MNASRNLELNKTDAELRTEAEAKTEQERLEQLAIERDWERQLVQRMVRGEEAAFDDFAEEFLPRLYRFAASRLRSRNDPELVRDIVQTTICKAIEKISSFRGDARLFTWLCSCCRNEMLMHFRKAERNRIHLEWDDVSEREFSGSGDGASAAAPRGPHHNLAAKERSALVHEALDHLPSRYARALEWKYIERVTVGEIAERMSCGLKAAESLLTRARTAFKKTFVDLLEPPAGPSIPSLRSITPVEGTQRTPS